MAALIILYLPCCCYSDILWHHSEAVGWNVIKGSDTIYGVFYKSLWGFLPLWYCSRDGRTKGEHLNRGRGTPSFCPTLHVLNMSTPGDISSTWQMFLAHAWQSWTMAPAGLFISQCRGRHCPGISCTTHELFCLGGSAWYLIWNLHCTIIFDSVCQIPRLRMLSYFLSTPCFVTTAP
jgi:hypothetical protein